MACCGLRTRSTRGSKPNAGTAIATMAKPISLPERAFVTLLAGNGDNVKGVKGLAMGLRKVGSNYPLVVAVLPDVPEEHRKLLDDLGCIVKEIEPVYPLKNQTQLVKTSHVINFSKLRIWRFEEYSKMIYLEGDAQLYSNIDDLFDLNDGYIYAPCHPWPESLTWPTEFGTPKPSFYFNGSMFVFVPEASIFDDLLKTIASIPPIPLAKQRLLILLNMFFRKKLMGLPEHNYRALTMLENHKENIDLDEVRVIHYCSPELKPWRFTPRGVNVDTGLLKKLKDKWLRIFHDESLKPDKKQRSLEMKTEIKRSRGVAFRRTEMSNGQKRVKEEVEHPRKNLEIK